MAASKNNQEIIHDYLKYYQTKDEKYSWAFHSVEAMEKKPEMLEFIFELIDSCLDDKEIAYVAAGPLQDLFNKQHLIIKGRLIDLVRQNPKMRKAIQAVWCSSDSPERKTLEEILNKFQLKYGSL